MAIPSYNSHQFAPSFISSRVGRYGMQFKSSFYLFCGLVVVAGNLLAQQPVQEKARTVASDTARTRPLSDYVLGPNDEFVIMAIDWEEVAGKSIRIGTGGDINLPMAGRIHAAGMTAIELEAELIKRMKVFIKNPDISVIVTQLKSQPVTVIGAVGTPGPVQLEGRMNLLEVMSRAGGLQPDASSTVTITRLKESGPLPFARASTDPDSPYSVAQINLDSIRDGSYPERNIPILPHDVISARRAPIVYVVGQVGQQGKFILNDRERVSVLQLIAMAGGTSNAADKKKVMIVRAVPGSIRKEVPVNLEDINKGKAIDPVLETEDILFIPEKNGAARILRQSLDTVMQTAVGLPLYRIGY